MDRPGEPVHNDQDPLGGGKAGDKIHGDNNQGRGGDDGGDLFQAQTVQSAIKVRTSAAMDGHQKRCGMRASVRWTPGWQVMREASPQVSTEDLADRGTNNQPGGHPSGTG